MVISGNDGQRRVSFRCPVYHGFPTCLRAWLPVLVGGEDALRLNATVPLAQRLRRPNIQLLRDGLDRGSLRAVVRSHIGDHPDRALSQLR
jgi:hypothetical protein